MENLDDLDVIPPTVMAAAKDEDDTPTDYYPTEGLNDEIIEDIHDKLDDDSKVNDIVDQVLGSKSTLETFVNQDRTDLDYSVFLENMDLDDSDKEEE